MAPSVMYVDTLTHVVAILRALSGPNQTSYFVASAGVTHRDTVAAPRVIMVR